MREEAKEFSRLAATPVSEALIGLFFGTSAVKKHDFGSPAHPVKKIAVLGAGLMGAGAWPILVTIQRYRRDI